jgi:membrane protein
MKLVSLHDLQNQLRRAVAYITVDIWRIRLEDLPFGKSFVIRQLRIILLTVRGFISDRCFYRASSLTFYTLLSIVPVAAMLFGIAKGFGFEKLLEKELYQQFSGQQEVVGKVVEFAQSLLESTKGGLIAGIGLVVLFWSVVKVLSHIEASLNEIWQIKEHRSWARKFSDYLAVMLISPLLILLAGSATVFITTQVTAIASRIKLLGLLSPLIFLSLKLIPYVLIWILFTVIYVLMPNTRVSLKAGAVAGIIAGTMYQVAQWLYISFQVGAAKYNAIYGSFAALPLFLMWVQISWWVVLFGAELSFANQNVATYEYEPDCLTISAAYKKLLTLQVAHLLIQNFSECAAALTDFQISQRLGIPIRLLHLILDDLIRSGLFVQARTDEDRQFGYQPACDINRLTIKYVLDAIEQSGTGSIPVVKTKEFEALSAAVEKFNAALEAHPANRLLKEI